MESDKPKSEAVTLKDRGIFYLNADINEASSKEVVTWILEANLHDGNKFTDLTLIITSPGGYTPHGFAIIDAMRGSSIPVKTVGLGMIASCGLLIFIAGKKGHRLLTPNTAILSHQFSHGLFGKEHELIAGAKEHDQVSARMIAHYKKYTGLSEKVIREKLLPPSDVWLSAKEALKYRLCDIVKNMS